MDNVILEKIYQKPEYLAYLRYNPKWYLFLDKDPSAYKDFEKVAKYKLKITTYDKVNNLKKQVDFINGMIKYVGSN